MYMYVYVYIFHIHILWLQFWDASPFEGPFWRRWLSADTKMTMRATVFFRGVRNDFFQRFRQTSSSSCPPFNVKNSEGSEDADAWSMLSRLLILGRWKINGWEIMVLARFRASKGSLPVTALFFFECSDVSVWRISSSLDIKHSNALLL